MEVRYTTGKNEYRRMTTEELRAAFLNTKLYERMCPHSRGHPDSNLSATCA